MVCASGQELAHRLHIGAAGVVVTDVGDEEGQTLQGCVCAALLMRLPHSVRKRVMRSLAAPWSGSCKIVPQTAQSREIAGVGREECSSEG